MNTNSKHWSNRRWVWLVLLVVMSGVVYLLWPRHLQLVARPMPSSPTSTPPSRPTTPPAPAKGAPSSSGCRTGTPLAGVYHPSRLKVLKPCQTVTGVVEKIRTEEDGDYHIDVRLDLAYSDLLIPGNAQQGGDLVIEIICVKPSSKAYEQAACNSYQKPDIPIPRVGSHIQVTGPYVNDTKHNWAEIHPVWQLVILSPTSGR